MGGNTIQIDTDDPTFTGIRKDTTKLSDEVVAKDPTLWREDAKRRRRRKFDDHRKIIFLKSLKSHGKINLAAEDAKVCIQTVADHRKGDVLFDDAVQNALADHAKSIIKKIEKRAMKGFKNDVFDKDGGKVGTKITFETQLAVKMLARYDAEYRDRTGLELTTAGGASIASPPILSMDDFLVVAAAARVKMLADQKAREEADAKG